MSERRGSHQIRAIGKGRPQNGRKVTVADGELLRQVIIKRNVRLIVKADGLIVDGGFDSIIDLLGTVVHANEPVIQALPKSVLRIQIISFLMCGEPRVVQVGDNASARFVKREHLRATIIEVGIETLQCSGRVQHARQTVYAGMVVWLTAAVSGGRVVGTARRITEGPEIIVEGVIFLHHYDDVIDFVQARLGFGRLWERDAHKKYNSIQKPNSKFFHSSSLLISCRRGLGDPSTLTKNYRAIVTFR